MFHRHARKHFSQAEGSQLDEVRQVMGMLAFPPDTHISPYKVSRACGLSGLGRAWAWDHTPHALSPLSFPPCQWEAWVRTTHEGSQPGNVSHLGASPVAFPICPMFCLTSLSFRCSSWPWRSTWGLGRCGHIALLASLLSIARAACLAS